MTDLLSLLSVNTPLVTIIGYPLSFIEAVGTIFYLWSIWLIAQRKMLTWPIGILSVILYCFLFYQIRLYSDMIEQLYYLGASVWGWWYWRQTLTSDDSQIRTRRMRLSESIFWLVVLGFGTLALFSLTNRLPILLPTIFSAPPAYPLADALTTIMSFIAMYLMARKYVGSWIYWIIVDIIGIWLYYIQDVKFLSLLYVILLALAIKGYIQWYRIGVIKYER